MPRHVETYDQAIEALYARINYERAQAGSYSVQDFKLERMRRLLALLGDPHERLPVVHIAGTKGKGSTAAMIAGMLSAAGYRTGLFTSPHVSRFEERMTVGGTAPEADELVDLVNAVAGPAQAMDRLPGQMSPTFFEIATAMAWLHFQRREAQVAVLEVGLGGRLDATNLCRPLACVVTNISLDHTALLGRTHAHIAREKAGIIKPGVPVVSGALQPAARSVVETVSRENGCELLQLGREVRFRYHPGQWQVSGEWTEVRGQKSEVRGRRSEVRSQRSDTQSPRAAPRGRQRTTDNEPLTIHHSPLTTHSATVDVETPLAAHQGVPVPLRGEHQAANAALAVAAVDLLRREGWQIESRHIHSGMLGVNWPVRIEVLGSRPTVVVDAAHNRASIAALVKCLAAEFRAARRILVFAATGDKDVSGMLRLLLPQFDAVVLTEYRNNPRVVPVERLWELAAEIDASRLHAAPDPASAWKMALDLAGPDDLICVTGSFFLAAEVRAGILRGRNESRRSEGDLTTAAGRGKGRRV